MKTYLLGIVDYAEMLKLRFREGYLDILERRTSASSGEEEHVTTHICPCGTTRDVGTHIVQKCEVYMKKRDALEKEMRK